MPPKTAAPAEPVVEEAPSSALSVFEETTGSLQAMSPEERMQLLRTQTEAQAHTVVDRATKNVNYLDVPLKVTKFLAHRNPQFDRPNADGELQPAYRTIFELADGQGLSFTSVAATNFVRLVGTVMGTLDFSANPLTIKITKVPARTGDTYNFQVL